MQEKANEKNEQLRDIPIEKHPNDVEGRSWKMPDKDLSREGWLDIVKPAYLKRGHTDFLMHMEVKNKLDKRRAMAQNFELTKRSFGMPKGYERIQWSGTRRDQSNSGISPTEDGNRTNDNECGK